MNKQVMGDFFSLIFVILYDLAPWHKESTHWKRPWCWKRLKAGEEVDNRGWDGWMASLTQWGREFEQALGDGEGQGSLACCSAWGHKKLMPSIPCMAYIFYTKCGLLLYSASNHSFLKWRTGRHVKEEKSEITLKTPVSIVLAAHWRLCHSDGPSSSWGDRSPGSGGSPSGPQAHREGGRQRMRVGGNTISMGMSLSKLRAFVCGSREVKLSKEQHWTL